MITFPNAKINLGLNVTAKRPDGYHDIESCFYPVQWCDILEIIPSENAALVCSGLPLNEKTKEENLVWKAYQILKNEYDLPNVHIHLHKVIPAGAGIGGGSSDAAFTLKILNSIFSLGLTYEALLGYAAIIGSDCSFFIKNTAAIATGRGTDLVPVSVSLSEKKIILINPQIHISTAEAYSRITPQPGQVNYHNVFTKPVGEWRKFLKNDFEALAFAKSPEIEKIVSQLYSSGAAYASMTGSGSTVFGIFEDELPILEFAKTYLVWSGKL